MLSLTSEYALRAMICLTRHADEGRVPTRSIANEAEIPRKYLSMILRDLVRAGFLSSSPGPGGGFRLVRSPKRIRLIELLAPFEPILTTRRLCPFGNQNCADNDPCAGHDRWKRVTDTYSQFLEKTSVYDLTVRPRERKSRGSRKRKK